MNYYTDLDKLSLKTINYITYEENQYIRECSKIINKFKNFVSKLDSSIEKINIKLNHKIETDIIYGTGSTENLLLIMQCLDKEGQLINNESSKEAFRSLMNINYLTPHVLGLKNKQSKNFSIDCNLAGVENLSKELLGEQLCSKIDYALLNTELKNKIDLAKPKKNKI